MASPHPALPESPMGFVGLGNMGLPMVLNALAAKRGPILITGRSRDRAARAITAGALWHDSARDLADTCPVIVLMVPDLPEVDELLFAARGIAESDRSTIVVVCSSVSPAGIRESDRRLKARTGGRMRLVDAPVSGGTEGAESGTLSIMVGGDTEPVARVLPLLAAFGTPIHLGPLGSGDIAKACNQLIVAATICGISEASVIAERSGLDVAALLTILEHGYAGSRVLATKRQRIVDRDYSPTGVARYMVKDLGFAAAAAVETATTTPVLDVLRQNFDELVEAGMGDLDLSVVHHWVESLPRE